MLNPSLIIMVACLSLCVSLITLLLSYLLFAVAAKDAAALANVLQNMAAKNQMMQQFCQMPMNPVNLSLAGLGPVEPVDLPLGLPCLPLTTMAHVDAFENLLLNEAYFKQVVRSISFFCFYSMSRFFSLIEKCCILPQVLFLGALGGADTFDTTRRVMSKLMTNRLAISFNWAGRPPKRAFRQIRCRDLVISKVILSFLLLVC